MSVTMMDNSGQPTPADVRTECEDLRAQLARARAAVVEILADFGMGNDFKDLNGDTEDNPYNVVQKTLSITGEELAAEYQRQYDEWVRESTDGQ